MGWLTGWNRRKYKTINGTSIEKTNVIVNLTIFKGPGTDTADTMFANNNIRDDFIDLRFTKVDGTTPLRYRILSITSGISANIIVEIDYLPVNPLFTQIYVYYDNPEAENAEDITLTTHTVIAIDNLNDPIPLTDSPIGFVCNPIFDRIYTYIIPSVFDEVWVAIKGLSTYESITNHVNGIMANDLYILFINNDLAFNVPLPTTTNTCYPVTATSPKSINITPLLTPLKGQSVNFRLQIIDSQGNGYEASSGAIYFITIPLSVENLGAWGLEELATIIPSNIVAIGITIGKTTCNEPCDVDVNVTWRNNGDIDDTFLPTLNIDGVPLSPNQFPSEILAAGASTTHTFTVTGLTQGSHTICPNPSGVTCPTVTVEKVMTGFSSLNTLMLGGLLFGFLLLSRRKEDEDKEMNLKKIKK